MKRISVQAYLNTYSGFGQMTCESIASLIRNGWDVAIKPLRVDLKVGDVNVPVSLEIIERIQPTDGYEWELTIAPLDRPRIPTPGKKAIYWTMWERESLNKEQITILNRCEAVIFPNLWCKGTFGPWLKSKPFIVPLGINPTIFQPSPMTMTGKCVFGAAGCMSASLKRKNLEAIVTAFSRLWAPKEDIELRVKVMPGEKLDADFADWPVTVNDSWMSWIDLARWYSSLTAFVNVGPEGWGLMAHQAAACGRPVLTPYYGGVQSFLHSEDCYPLGYRTRMGAMMVNVDSLGVEMQRVYLDRIEAQEIGRKAADWATELTWEKSGQTLNDVLSEIIGTA